MVNYTMVDCMMVYYTMVDCTMVDYTMVEEPPPRQSAVPLTLEGQQKTKVISGVTHLPRGLDGPVGLQ